MEARLAGRDWRCTLSGLQSLREMNLSPAAAPATCRRPRCKTSNYSKAFPTWPRGLKGKGLSRWRRTRVRRGRGRSRHTLNMQRALQPCGATPAHAPLAPQGSRHIVHLLPLVAGLAVVRGASFLPPFVKSLTQDAPAPPSAVCSHPAGVDYLNYVSMLNQVVMMGTQLFNDATVPQHHKYAAHQIALLYVSRQACATGRRGGGRR